MPRLRLVLSLITSIHRNLKRKGVFSKNLKNSRKLDIYIIYCRSSSGIVAYYQTLLHYKQAVIFTIRRPINGCFALISSTFFNKRCWGVIIVTYYLDYLFYVNIDKIDKIYIYYIYYYYYIYIIITLFHILHARVRLLYILVLAYCFIIDSFNI